MSLTDVVTDVMITFVLAFEPEIAVRFALVSRYSPSLLLRQESMGE